MMNYSELPDLEITKRVAKLTGNYGSCEPAFNAVYRSSGTQYDPINRPEQAWPIIVANRISINPYEKADQGWFATPDSSFFVDDANPLRAAMVVYLMMQEQKA